MQELSPCAYLLESISCVCLCTIILEAVNGLPLCLFPLNRDFFGHHLHGHTVVLTSRCWQMAGGLTGKQLRDWIVAQLLWADDGRLSMMRTADYLNAATTEVDFAQSFFASALFFGLVYNELRCPFVLSCMSFVPAPLHGRSKPWRKRTSNYLWQSKKLPT